MTKISKDRGLRDLSKHPVTLKDGSVLTEETAAAWDLEIEQRWSCNERSSRWNSVGGRKQQSRAPVDEDVTGLD